MRNEWFPATVLQPRSAVTFEALDLFMACTLTGKMSAFDFYKALTYLTDVLGLNIPKVCGIVSALLILIAPPEPVQATAAYDPRISTFAPTTASGKGQ